MTLYKYVAGIGKVEMTPEEEAATLAEWEANANAPQPLPDLEPYQFFSMLDISGKTDALNAFIDGLPSPQNIIARNKLNRTLVFHRDNDLVLAAQQALQLSDAELDGLWKQAAAIQ